jgi:hypothetical protein
MGVGDHDCRRIDPFLMVEPSAPQSIITHTRPSRTSKAGESGGET